MTTNRAEIMTTITERDKTLFYRIIRKILKQQMKEGKLIEVPARRVFELADKMSLFYFQKIEEDLEQGEWDLTIKQLMTRGM